jgi:hypothetical protein
MTTEVNIPDEAWDAVVSAVPIEAVVAAKGSAWDINELQERAVRAAAPLILAAELERLAGDVPHVYFGDQETQRVFDEGVAHVVTYLRPRASELRGEGQ